MGLGEMSRSTLQKSLKILSSASLQEIIPSTMGEPLLYPYFEDLLEISRQLNAKINLTTNGSFPLGVDYWKTKLLLHCSDIKVSMMGLSSETNELLMLGQGQKEYLQNIQALIQEQKRLRALHQKVASVTLQVTVCKKNQDELEDILDYAQEKKIQRVKFNKAVFLSTSSAEFLDEYALDDSPTASWRFTAQKLKQKAKIPISGTLLQNRSTKSQQDCPFSKEIWVLPNGDLQKCPNPENRFGDPSSATASCANCPCL